MASHTAKITFRIVMVALALLVVFYMGRPLYWKISATIHEIRQNKQTVKQGLSQIVLEAQKTVGWYHDESDSGTRETRIVKKVTTRRLMLNQLGLGILRASAAVARNSSRNSSSDSSNRNCKRKKKSKIPIYWRGPPFLGGIPTNRNPRCGCSKVI